MSSKTLVAEISGKRPGDVKSRPTEKMQIDCDKVIISNNSEGYVTEWPIVNVPDDYREWYTKANNIQDDIFYGTSMNRSYAIKYAKEHGYDYLVQLDDNITCLEIAYRIVDKETGFTRLYRSDQKLDKAQDFINMLICVLENTNAGIAGFDLAGSTVPSCHYLSERYVYSFWAFKLSVCPELFHGSFEEDIEYRLKLKDMGIPAVQVAPFRYGKVGQYSSSDTTGNRSAYNAAGVERGTIMRTLWGDYFSCGISHNAASTNAKQCKSQTFYRHKIKAFKLGVIVYDREKIDAMFASILEKWTKSRPDAVRVREKRKKR